MGGAGSSATGGFEADLEGVDPVTVEVLPDGAKIQGSSAEA